MTKYRRILFGSVFALSGLSTVAQDNPALLKVGPVEVRPSVAYDFTYDDNIFLGHRSGNKVEDYIHTISPGVILGAGEYRTQTTAFLSAAYNADFQFFMDNAGADTTLHNASLAFGNNSGRLSWRFDQGLVSQQDADVTLLAARGRVKRQAWSSTLSSVYDLGERSNLEASFASVLNDFDAANAQDSWRGQANGMLDYELTPKINAGLGAAFGYDQIDEAHNATFEQVNTRLVWGASAKLSISAELGVEFRQFQGVDVDKAFLRYAVGADWKATALTTVSLRADRGASPANTLQDQSNLRSSVDAAVTHRVGDRYTANANIGYSFNDFFAVTPAATATFAAREDNFWFIRPSFAAKLMDRTAGVLFYQYSRNDSDLANNGNDFTNHRFGVNLSYTF